MRRADRATGEQGMTIVEVVVAGMILVVGALGVLGMVDASTRNTFRAEQSQVVANVLQAEMEELRQKPYQELALEELPTHSTDPDDPDSRIANTSFFYTGRAGTGLKPLVYNGGSSGGETIEDGTVEPSGEFSVGGIAGTVQRYVVWDTCPPSLCQDGEHLKRLVVAVSLDETASGGARRYQESQGQAVDPEVAPESFPGEPGSGSDTVPWKLWLTDTPCDQAERLPLPEAEGNHPSHNTRGDCADGPVEGENVPGAPDLLWPEPPVLPPEEAFPDPLDYPDYEYDYASELEPQPEEDAGLQLLPAGECDSTQMTDLARGVATEPDAEPGGDPAAFQKVHRWLSAPIPPTESSDEILLTGEGTLNLWTRTVGGAIHPGRLCAWLFVRSYEAGTIADTLVVNLGPPLNLHFEHFAQSWPSDGWTEVSVPLRFGHAGEGGALPLPEGSRLGLALAVGDSSNGLQLIYDEPSFESRLSVETTGALPPGA